MTYEEERFVEHHEVRLPVLNALVNEFGWKRDQIICPEPNSDDTEWRVPKSPSMASRREAGQAFEGFPCDIAIFDSPSHRGDPEHLIILIECKAPNVAEGSNQLETYLGLEPTSLLGILVNGTKTTRIYKLPSGGFRRVPGSTLPRPTENLLLADPSLTGAELLVPSQAQLTSALERLLEVIVATDSRSTRQDQQLNQVCNLILVKLESDSHARVDPASPVDFQIKDDPSATAADINILYGHYRSDRPDLFGEDDHDAIELDAGTIQAAVAELQPFDLVDMAPTALSLAFQIFRNKNKKSEDGQYYTPRRVVEAATACMEITVKDKVIDPACGTGGFLSEAFLEVSGKVDGAEAIRWANNKLYGIDKDAINTKIARALMVGFGDGSSHIKRGDSILTEKWVDIGHGFSDVLKDGAYSVVITNPPFGENLKVSANDAQAGEYSICRRAHKRKSASAGYSETQIGVVFVERAWRLLRPGGRLGIVLPETYFFSPSYSWFRKWLDDRFVLRGVLNIPMEAFQGFCRAKTNFYIFQKNGTLEERRLENEPSWFRDGSVWVSNAPTIGINAHGNDLYRIDSRTNEMTEDIDDDAIEDVRALLDAGNETPTSRFVDYRPMSESYIGVPSYSDPASLDAIDSFRDWCRTTIPGSEPVPLGTLYDKGMLEFRSGHGSPSPDQREGDIPYIKVSDLRNGLVNPNPSNMVPSSVARKRFWKGEHSGIKAWDIISPSRASKNIGEFVMVLPGEEDVVLTREVLVLRATAGAVFDDFYLFWALSLPRVRTQWNRIVFMQTNREDLGERWREIEIPVPGTAEDAQKLARPVEKYYQGLVDLKQRYNTDMRPWMEDAGDNSQA